MALKVNIDVIITCFTARWPDAHGSLQVGRIQSTAASYRMLWLVWNWFKIFFGLFRRFVSYPWPWKHVGAKSIAIGANASHKASF
jgi:hypothetical protein